MAAKRVVRYDGTGYEIRALRHDARVYMTAVIAVGPTVEATIAYGSEIVWNQVRPQFVALVRYDPESVRSWVESGLFGLRKPVANTRDRPVARSISHTAARFLSASMPFSVMLLFDPTVA